MILDGEISAIVTGASSGMGKATAEALSAAGVRVAIFDRDEVRGREIAESIGGGFFQVDVTSDMSVAAGFSAARQAQGPERILVNCAGIAAPSRVVSSNPDQEAGVSLSNKSFEMQVAVNLTGTFRCISNAAAGMVRLPELSDGERGVIINTASIAAEDGQAGQVAYAASKAGIVGMMLPLAREFSTRGIRVNTILPGVVGTPMLDVLSDELRQVLGASVPFPKRAAHPDEFASLVLELCRNRYLNASAIRFDGALRLAAQ